MFILDKIFWWLLYMKEGIMFWSFWVYVNYFFEVIIWYVLFNYGGCVIGFLKIRIYSWGVLSV